MQRLGEVADAEKVNELCGLLASGARHSRQKSRRVRPIASLVLSGIAISLAGWGSWAALTVLDNRTRDQSARMIVRELDGHQDEPSAVAQAAALVVRAFEKISAVTHQQDAVGQDAETYLNSMLEAADEARKSAYFRGKDRDKQGKRDDR